MDSETSHILSPVSRYPEANSSIEGVEILDRTIQAYPPTVQQFGALQLAFDHFNRTLFDGHLPACILNLSRKRGSGGFFTAEEWENEGQVVHEISLNPTSLTPPIISVMATLVHEMVHLWQEEYGDPGRRGYHNVEWADKMEEVGLIPSATGGPGGKRIGDRMTHYVDPDGPFKRAFEGIPEPALLPWRNAIKTGNDAQNGGESGGGGRKSKVKYSCPSCPANVWGKPGLQIRCGCGQSTAHFNETD